MAFRLSNNLPIWWAVLPILSSSILSSPTLSYPLCSSHFCSSSQLLTFIYLTYPKEGYSLVENKISGLHSILKFLSFSLILGISIYTDCIPNPGPASPSNTTNRESSSMIMNPEENSGLGIKLSWNNHWGNMASRKDENRNKRRTTMWWNLRE